MAESRQDASMDAEDTTLVRIGQAIMLHRGGDREEARNRFALLWQESEESGHLFHRCTIAHYMAGAQDDPADALAWERLALSAADALCGAGARWGAHLRAVRALYPSLHLALAGGHARLGDVVAARRELGLARGRLDALEGDAFGEGVRDSIERLERSLSA